MPKSFPIDDDLSIPALRPVDTRQTQRAGSLAVRKVTEYRSDFTAGMLCCQAQRASPPTTLPPKALTAWCLGTGLSGAARLGSGGAGGPRQQRRAAAFHQPVPHAAYDER